MSPKAKANLFWLALLPLTAALLVATGCSSGVNSATSGGPVFVVGTDAPLASVVSFKVQIDSIVLTNSTTNSTSNNLLATSPTTVDFARYNGLQGLIDMTGVQPGTYDGVTITLGSASISYLNTSNSPPTITTLTASTTPAVTLTTSSVSLTLKKSITVNDTGGVPVGLRMDFDLRDSIETDSSGAFTGTVDPTFYVAAVARTDTGAHIDEFIGSVTTLPSSTSEPSSFVITGPHGEAFTINTTSTTEWDGSATLASLTSTSIVAVAGQFDPAAQTLDADEVAVISDSGFYAGGLVTYVTPSSGQATDMQFYVRGVLPSGLSAVPLGGIADVSITGDEKYGIFWMDNAFTNLLFNADALTPGQEITVGGTDPTASPFDVKRIHLQDLGYVGTVVSGSQASGSNGFGTDGAFTMTVTGFAGQVISSNVLVYLGPKCDYRYGFGAFSDLSNGASVRVVGILVKNQSSGQLVLLARHVDGFVPTDMTASASQP